MSKAVELTELAIKKFGANSSALGSIKQDIPVVSTGSLALDYALGTGGWPGGHSVEIFGPPDIGKSSVLAFSAVREQQRQDKICVWIAVEPNFDAGWAIKNGVDPDQLVMCWPDNGQQAFNMLQMMIENGADFIVFDSIGALLRPTEAEVGGKASQGGQAGLVTWGVKNAIMPAWRRRASIMYLNQVRDDMDSQYSLYDSPGGWALKHSCTIRIELKNGDHKKKEYVKVDGDDIVSARQITCHIKRNKLREGQNHRALLTYNQMQTNDHGVGIDQAFDLITTGPRLGIIRQAGAWFYHETFPDGKLNGKAAVTQFIEGNEKAFLQLRAEALEKIQEVELNDEEAVIADA